MIITYGTVTFWISYDQYGNGEDTWPRAGPHAHTARRIGYCAQTRSRALAREPCGRAIKVGLDRRDRVEHAGVLGDCRRPVRAHAADGPLRVVDGQPDRIAQWCPQWPASRCQ